MVLPTYHWWLLETTNIFRDHLSWMLTCTDATHILFYLFFVVLFIILFAEYITHFNRLIWYIKLRIYIFNFVVIVFNIWPDLLACTDYIIG